VTRVLVCTPTYDEVTNISELLHRVREALPDADILVLDDNSPDGTADVAEKVGAEVGYVEVLRRPEKRGLGEAYRAGFAVGIARDYDVIVQIDADLSHDPAVLPQLIAALDDGADLAIGSRYVPGGSTPYWPWRRKALSRYGNLYAGYMLRTKVNDNSAGFRAFKTDTLKALEYQTTRAKGYGFQLELTYRLAQMDGKVAEVPITFTDRVRGNSKMSLSVMMEEMILMTWWGLRDRLRTRGDGRGKHRPSV
jgi:dolichol-phosphate mannosyltransferase